MRRHPSLARSLAFALFAVAARLGATSVVPLSDAELYARADVIVHGVVLSTDTVADANGVPQTVSVIDPLRVWKGRLAGPLVLRQAGGVLPDGRFFKLWGRPEYVPGREVVVFAIARPDGGFETAELLLGKFEVHADASGQRFAVPDLAAGVHPGVAVLDREARADGESLPAPRRSFRVPDRATAALPAPDAPRSLAAFLDFLAGGAAAPLDLSAEPVGILEPVSHAPSGMRPEWGMINNSLWRWNNGAGAAWATDGTANMTGGGLPEALGALAAWTDDSTSNVNYTAGSSASVLHMSAATSPCGWSTCITSSGGVIGCGGPSGGGSNSWRGETYSTITRGEVWLRCYATANAFGSTITQSVLTHELGHTLGLGHSDQQVSPHDVCRGDEGAAIMRSSAQSRATLGTDDRDSIRWLYGDGGNSCSSFPAPSVGSASPSSGTAAGGATLVAGGTDFVAGATVRVGGVPATVTSLTSTSLSVRTGAHAVGMADVAVTNPDAQSASLPGGYFYDFLDVPASHIFHNGAVKIFKSGITAGCGGNDYCPAAAVTRDQMAVFVLRGVHGSAYQPPTASGEVFSDVPAGAMFAGWMEHFYSEGIIDACDSSPLSYCPSAPVSRSEMAVLLLRARHGNSYVPPAPSGIFRDVPVWHRQAAWIERLFAEGITSGCGGGNYCPDRANTRGEMAVFLSRTFGLP